jgi:hypothetical protein
MGQVLRDILVSGAAASLVSTLALALAGRRELGDPATPLNGPSQWIWGRHAKYRDGFTVRHTVVGYAVHHVASTFWVALYEWLRPGRRDPAKVPHDIAAAAAVAATAAAVDFRLTPQRLRPGFEKRLSRSALVAIYAAFALGLAARSLRPRR